MCMLDTIVARWIGSLARSDHVDGPSAMSCMKSVVQEGQKKA